MPLQKFQIESLATIDEGRIKAAFEQLLHDLVQDCHDRPELESSRKLTLTVTVKPSTMERGELRAVDLAFDLKPTTPKRESRTYNMMTVRGGIAYNELSPNEARQRTLDDVPGPRAEKPEEGAPPSG